MLNDQKPICIFWFRRDLRLTDNHGLSKAISSGLPVLPVFIFDKNILQQLDNHQDARVSFIYNTVTGLNEDLQRLGSSLLVLHNRPADALKEIIEKHNIAEVYTNHDYEPYALERDTKIKELLLHKNIPFHTFRDQVIFEKKEIAKDNGEPYTVFTPYSRKWQSMLSEQPERLNHFPDAIKSGNFIKTKPFVIPTLKELGFIKNDLPIPPIRIDNTILKSYSAKRDFPAQDGTSHLGIHLRFGTVSIREIAKKAYELSPVFLNELVWREFYQSILFNFPRVGKGFSFKPAYDNIPWVNDESAFKHWCEGTTGYPIVDAGMRELVNTGYMHNRVRMITASFLCKHLLTDWRWGEAWFARHLLDFDLASNNGGWQWAAGSGCDATPYFRIFNPTLQQKKFDPNAEYIKRWVPEWNTPSYPQPIIQHEFARKRCLDVYTKALKEMAK